MNELTYQCNNEICQANIDGTRHEVGSHICDFNSPEQVDAQFIQTNRSMWLWAIGVLRNHDEHTISEISNAIDTLHECKLGLYHGEPIELKPQDGKFQVSFELAWPVIQGSAEKAVMEIMEMLQGENFQMASDIIVDYDGLLS